MQNTEKLQQKKTRIYWIEFIRAFACLCVILTHSPIPYIGQGGQPMLGSMTYLGNAGGVNLFFMISGAVLLYKERQALPFLKKQLIKIIPPVIIWTVIFLLLDCFFYNEFDTITLLKKLAKIPFGTQEPTFWFIYVLIGIYLLIPILSYWLNKATQKEITFYLLMWSITLLIPYLNLFNENLGKSITHKVGWLYYFNGYVGFAVLGFYCRKFINIKTINWKYLTVLFIICILPFLLKISGCPTKVICNKLSLHVVLLSISIFVLLKYIIKPHRYSYLIYKFARFAFGIYLVQGIFIRILKMYLTPLKLNYFIQIPLSLIIIGLCSFVLVWLVSRFPYSKYIVGPVRDN